MRTLGARRWWVTGLVLAILEAMSRLAGRGAGGSLEFVFSLVGLLFWTWLIVTVFQGGLGLWKRLTYRIGVRLFFSYLLIGVAPFFMAAILGGFALYLAMGQYTSVQWGGQSRLMMDRVARRCSTAVEIGHEKGPDAMFAWLRELAEAPPPPLTKVLWVARDGRREERSAGAADFDVPEWVGSEPTAALVENGGAVFSIVAARQGERGVLLAVPLDRDLAVRLNQEGWYDVFFYLTSDSLFHGGPQFTVTEEKDSGQGGSVRVSGRPVPVGEVWGPWPSDPGGGLFERPIVVWFRLAGRLVDLRSGDPKKDINFITLLRTSPAAVWRNFVHAPYALGEQIKGILIGVGGVLGVLYLMVVGVAILMILAITRATSRLTLGARQVAAGNLEYRIPVKRRDQLGDLALSFNGMAEAVQRMLVDVAEKERLAHELELARQIQENLLPSRRITLGGLEVRASFRPAAEVGGDYFDVLTPDAGKLIIAVGDVAGHGLATGLFMASVKSAVAAFVGEGYRGAELLERLQALMLQANRQHRQPMVTLAVAEIDLDGKTVRVASAGHPPALVVRAGGSVEEVLLGSMPLGFPHCRPRERVLPFEPGCALVLYSDGLVEATNGREEPLGYAALERVVAGAGWQPEVLLARIEGALERHVQNRALSDDVTVVVVGASDAARTPAP